MTIEDMEDYLPIGHHLLPKEYSRFLYDWNKAITDTTGWWTGPPRKLYKRVYSEEWNYFNNQNRRFMVLYAKEVAALKQYQANYQEHTEEDSMPPHPPSPEPEETGEPEESGEPEETGQPEEFY